MAVVNKAKFKINNVLSSAGFYRAVRGEALNFALEDPAGVASVIYSVYDASDAASPLASKDAPDVLFSNALHAQAPATPSGNAIMVMPNSLVTDGHTWVIRATATAPEGIHIYERMVSLGNGKPRKTIPGEFTQSGPRGWSDAWNDVLAAVAPFQIWQATTTNGSSTPMTVPTFLRPSGPSIDPDGLLPPANCSFLLAGVVAAAQHSSALNCKFMYFEAGYSVDLAGNVTLRSGPTLVRDVDFSSGSFNIALSNVVFTNALGVVKLAVTGLAATTIRWEARADLTLIRNGG